MVPNTGHSATESPQTASTSCHSGLRGMLTWTVWDGYLPPLHLDCQFGSPNASNSFLLPFYGTYHFTCFLLHFGLVLSGLRDTSGSSKISNIGFDFLKEPAEMGPLFHSMGLQQYIILCSQVFFCYEINYTYLLDGLIFLSLFFLFYQFFNITDSQ